MIRLATLTILLIPTTLLAADPAPPASPDPAGCWSGYWISCTSGHKGPLNARICQIDENCYQATFTGRFWAVFPFRYTTTMQVTGRDADKVYLSSSRRLPLLGRFEMNAVVTATDFNATYSSRDDNGQFIMQRK
jgi:hypothetical protein